MCTETIHSLAILQAAEAVLTRRIDSDSTSLKWFLFKLVYEFFILILSENKCEVITYFSGRFLYTGGHFENSFKLGIEVHLADTLL